MNILTSSGFRHFEGFLDQGERETLEITTNFNNRLVATPDHEVKLHDGSFTSLSSLNVDDRLWGGEYITEVNFGNIFRVYDAFEVATTHDYYTNGIISHNCNILYVDEAAIIPNNIAEQFFTAVFPVVSSGETTKVILTSTPLGYNHFWKFWNEAEKGNNGFHPVRVEYWEHPKHLMQGCPSGIS